MIITHVSDFNRHRCPICQKLLQIDHHDDYTCGWTYNFRLMGGEWKNNDHAFRISDKENPNFKCEMYLKNDYYLSFLDMSIKIWQHQKERWEELGYLPYMEMNFGDLSKIINQLDTLINFS